MTPPEFDCLVIGRGIAVHHRGLLMIARRRESLAVIEELAETGMGAGCRVLPGRRVRLPPPRPG